MAVLTVVVMAGCYCGVDNANSDGDDNANSGGGGTVLW